MRLADVWISTLRAQHARGDLAAAGAELFGRWLEPHRRYHNADHLVTVLSSVDELADVATDAGVVRLAAFFHDAVYDPLRADNEELSADLATRTLRDLRVDAAVVDEVARLVLLTATHDPDEDDRDGAVLCDADLAVLARSLPQYAAYVSAVRDEYAALDEGTWRSGRAAVLRRLLARPTVYRTAPYQGRLEQAARANLMGELEALSAAEPPEPSDA